MGIVINFPAERCTVGSGLIAGRDDSGSVIILPVIRVERQDDTPSAPSTSTSSPRGKRRKR
jgi:hypothetical protein